MSSEVTAGAAAKPAAEDMAGKLLAEVGGASNQLRNHAKSWGGLSKVFS